MKKRNLKVFIKVEFLLIVFSLLTGGFSIYTKIRTRQKFDSIERNIALFQLKYVRSDDSADLEETAGLLRSSCQTLCAFNPDVSIALEKLLDSSNSFPKDNQAQFVSSIIDFQYLITLKQNKLDFCYEVLIGSSFFLLFLTTIIILLKFLNQKTELIKIKTVNEAQQKFSRDLHDGAAQDLATLKLYLSQNDKEKSILYADQAFKEIRYLIDSLHMDLSTDLKTIFQEMCLAFQNNYNIQVNLLFASTKIELLPDDTKIELIRVLQEALNNTARHAQATKSDIKTIDSPDSILFTITDNGKGISQDDLNKYSDNRKHYGLQNIRERISSIGGSVDYITTGGTTIAITIKNSIR